MIFFILRVIPGDVATLIVTAGGEGKFNERAYREVRQQLDLDKPLPVQYARWVGGAIKGDLGSSYWSRTSVREEIADRLPVTLELALAAPILAVLLGVPLGIISAVKQNSPLDYLARFVSITGLSVPHFW